MKKLLGFLFCFALLLLVHTTQAQTQSEPARIQQLAYLDAVQPLLSLDVLANVPVQKSITLDVVKHRELLQLVAFQPKEALFYRYQLVPACPVNYISKEQGKHYFNTTTCKQLAYRGQSSISI